jgi:hypothetical protein
MKRTLILGAAVLAGLFGWISATQAQVFVRAPFVRVQVGNGVYVRAPFVNLYIPSTGQVVYDPYAPPPPNYAVPPQPASPPAGSQLLPPPRPVSNPQPLPTPQPVPAPAVQDPNAPPPPLPAVKDPNAPPQPAVATAAPTIESFAKSFQAKAGSYEVTMLNPVTKQPTAVRFTLPDGTPRRVLVGRNQIEFVYGLRQFVRIEFDRDGVTVVSR